MSVDSSVESFNLTPAPLIFENNKGAIACDDLSQVTISALGLEFLGMAVEANVFFLYGLPDAKVYPDLPPNGSTPFSLLSKICITLQLNRV